MEAEILAVLKEGGPMDVGDLAVKTRLPENVLHLFVRTMVEEEKLKIKTVGIE